MQEYFFVFFRLKNSYLFLAFFTLTVSLLNFLDRNLSATATPETPASAKEEKRFWAFPWRAENGHSVDVLGDQVLFQSVFPGYPDRMRKDQELWKAYFQEIFIQGVQLDSLGNGDFSDYLKLPSHQGCAHIIDRYGVDIVFMGNSEIFRVVVLDFLAEKIRQGLKLKRPPRILLCGGDLSLPGIKNALRELAPFFKKRIKLLFLGYSIDAPLYPYQKKRPLEIAKPKKRIQPLSWDAVVAGKPQLWDEWMPMAFQFDPRYIPKTKRMDSLFLEENATKIKPDCGHFKGITSEACQLVGAEADLREIQNIVREFSQKLLIYVPATTPLHFGTAPKCLDPAIRKMIAKHSEIPSLTQTWTDYGLHWRDFLVKTRNPNWLYIDENHPNLSGAKKLNRVFAHKILEVLKTIR